MEKDIKQRTFTRSQVSQIVRHRVNLLNARNEYLENEIAILKAENEELKNYKEREAE